MSQLLQSYAAETTTSIIIAVTAFVLGNFRKELALRLRTRKTRKYWQALRGRGITIVLGAQFRELGGGHVGTTHRPIDNQAIIEFEPYGMVGFGDVLALLEIQKHLELLGLGDVRVAHSQHLQQEVSRNLVLIGGPDANSATSLTMAARNIPVVFVDDGSGKTAMDVTIDGSVEHFRPEFASPTALNRDVGFVAQTASPFEDDATAVLLVGVYGAATYAAAQLVTSPSGVSRLLQPPARCIAIFSTSVSVHGDVSRPHIERCEALPS